MINCLLPNYRTKAFTDRHVLENVMDYPGMSARNR
jgi:hypothetical protein